MYIPYPLFYLWTLESFFSCPFLRRLGLDRRVRALEQPGFFFLWLGDEMIPLAAGDTLYSVE